ncbi:MAG: hypothetical protein L0312_04135, partial [Acidobacteria bacterium]|nr:hypothetical protein [Acidobacteriota bacterium]
MKIVQLALTIFLALCLAVLMPVERAVGQADTRDQKLIKSEKAGRSEGHPLLLKYPKLTAEPFGKGIFAHVYAGGRLRESQEQLEAWAKNPYIAGTQLSFSWLQLEPKPGEYRWDLIEQQMEVWAQNGKKCWIEVSTASKRDKGDGGKPRGAPDWVYLNGVPKIQA